MANNDPETVAQLYGVFLYKKKDIIAIQKKLGISGNANQLVVPPVSELMKKTLADSYELLLELVGDLIPIQEKLNIDENIIAIQDKLDIVGYSNQERAEEVDENMRACLRKLKEFHGPLEDDPGVIFPKYGEMGVKKIMFTGEGLPLFPKLSPQQLHEIFVKNPSSAGQCPCLEQVS
ncbi:hypothetical protein RhiirA1_475011 [Rhizophagus irregularis]|uniref:Uncharacterized protein n=1 Tax=Rhizophagus irregularis TaxID=588596 RepID=A0A2N0QXK9_9GLOM|nr:hypothetical protein RhiirA1_475011 [Rhizophagus irregularis]